MSARSLNKVLLIGNLTRDPELRYTPQGTPVCTFGLATNRSWTSSSGGERQEETEFHRIVAWQKLAELCSQLLFKGRKVYVEGRLQTRNWTGQDGQERSTTEVVIDNMIVLDSKRRAGEEELAAAEPSAINQPQAANSAVSDDKKKAAKNKKKDASETKQNQESETAEAPQEQKEPEVKAEDIPF